jgi:hypothetical protein
MRNARAVDTNAHKSDSLDAVVEAVIGAEVSNVLGGGFLEKVYERAFTREFDAGAGESGRRFPTL